MSLEPTNGGTCDRARDVDGGTQGVMDKDASWFAALLGPSWVNRPLSRRLARVARTDNTLLIEGETGTGKSFLARAIHARNGRKSNRFVVVDCASVHPTLIENELFGHAKGAYTGASSKHGGAFVAAEGGTLFLDEIGELPLELQVKLLRVIEEKVVKPIGSAREVPVDVRVLAATNRCLGTEVAVGRFRMDLYHRINVLSVQVPPLRERREDILHFARRFWSEVRGDPGNELPQALTDELLRSRLAGNVRELRNLVLRRAVWGDEHSVADRALAPASSARDDDGQAPSQGPKTANREKPGGTHRHEAGRHHQNFPISIAGHVAYSPLTSASCNSLAEPPTDRKKENGRDDSPGSAPSHRTEQFAERSETGVQPASQPAGAEGIAEATCFQPGVSYSAAKGALIACWERSYIRSLLDAAGGNVSRAARMASMDRCHLRRLIKRFIECDSN